MTSITRRLYVAVAGLLDLTLSIVLILSHVCRLCHYTYCILNEIVLLADDNTIDTELCSRERH